MIFVSWDNFKEALNLKYGPYQFLDLYGELTRLQQTGTIQEYQDKFEKLLAKVGPLEQARQVSSSIGGLRDSIRTDQEMTFVSWDDFKEGLNLKYGPNQFLDFYGKLTKWQQTGTIQEYQDKFEKLLAKAGSMEQARQVSSTRN
ncbi:hypothetical protein LWI28_020623 [Acer negundo]|uniref:Retrotransposon gag domain-containing protein n=1 Tax=Acer negundo TaxID=4023 RepID=A0AAD5NKH7_ACENE|nr:hypothetical protein LWI28_020623 [Acer negundo]